MAYDCARDGHVLQDVEDKDGKVIYQECVMCGAFK